jgi:hypothetical protein
MISLQKSTHAKINYLVYFAFFGHNNWNWPPVKKNLSKIFYFNDVIGIINLCIIRITSIVSYTVIKYDYFEILLYDIWSQSLVSSEITWPIAMFYVTTFGPTFPCAHNLLYCLCKTFTSIVHAHKQLVQCKHRPLLSYTVIFPLYDLGLFRINISLLAVTVTF